MQPADGKPEEGQSEIGAEEAPLKPWTAPLLSLIVVDVTETKGASGIGHDGGASGFNAS